MQAGNMIARHWKMSSRWLGATGLAVVLTACGGGGGTGSASEGTLRVALTDAPSCYAHVWVTVEKVRVHQSAGAADTDGGWTDLTLVPARRIDLTERTNGVLEELGTMPLAAGSYSQVRLVLASNTATGTSSALAVLSRMPQRRSTASAPAMAGSRRSCRSMRRRVALAASSSMAFTYCHDHTPPDADGGRQER